MALCTNSDYFIPPQSLCSQSRTKCGQAEHHYTGINRIQTLQKYQNSTYAYIGMLFRCNTMKQDLALLFLLFPWIYVTWYRLPLSHSSWIRSKWMELKYTSTPNGKQYWTQMGSSTELATAGTMELIDLSVFFLVLPRYLRYEASHHEQGQCLLQCGPKVLLCLEKC